jgi:hypothetical protein
MSARVLRLQVRMEELVVEKVQLWLIDVLE